MRFGPIEIKDKADRTIVLRNALPEDAEELIRLLKTAAGETPYLLREPDEITMTREQEEAFVKHCLDSERSLMVVALLDGQLVGNCSVNPVGDYKRYFHRCEVALAIYREFWGCGIGRRMLESVLERQRKPDLSRRSWRLSLAMRGRSPYMKSSVSRNIAHSLII